VDIGSCGELLPNLEVKICVPVDESSWELTSSAPQELGLGETGELHVRGPNVFMDYHKNPAATLACRTPDGWFRTGDVGHINERGNLFITDRVKELIKYKGFKVPPAELEGYLLEFPGVIDCAVVGVWHKEMATEVPRAYVVSRDASKPVDTEELMAWFGSRVASYQKLRGGVKRVQEIPKNASGKILRKKLKERARAEFETEQRLENVARL
jgi:acyl-CoA synthetase (AMP-forming)/AMP-acid ligase II